MAGPEQLLHRNRSDQSSTTTQVMKRLKLSLPLLTLLIFFSEARYHHQPSSISPQQFYDFAHLLSHWSVAILTDEDLYLARVNLRNVGGEYNEIFTNVTLVDMYNDVINGLNQPTVVSHRNQRAVKHAAKDTKCNLDPPKESELSCPRFKRAHFDPERDVFLVLEECYGRLIVVDLLLMEMRLIRGTADIIDFVLLPSRDNRILYYLTADRQYVCLWRANVVLNKRPILRTESRSLLLNISVAAAARRQVRMTVDNINTFRAASTASTIVTRIFVFVPDPLSVIEMGIHKNATTTRKTLHCSDQGFRNATVLNFFYQDQFGVTTAMLHNKRVQTLDTYVGFLYDEDTVRDNCMVRDLDHQNLIFGRADAVTHTHSHWLVTSANLHKCTHSYTKINMRFEFSANRGQNFRLLHTWNVPMEIKPDYWVRDIAVRTDLLNMGQPDDIYVIDSMGLCSPYSKNFNDEALFAGTKPVVVDAKKVPLPRTTTTTPKTTTTTIPTSIVPTTLAPPLTKIERKNAPFRTPSRNRRPRVSTTPPTPQESSFLGFLHRAYEIGMRGKRSVSL